MSAGIQGLGWFMRRTRDPIALASFYEKALGLPRLRSWQTDELCGVMLWAGEVGVLETNLLNPQADGSPEDTSCIPVFRSDNLAASSDRLAGFGLLPTDTEEDERATTHFFQDIDGLPFGVEQLHRADLNSVDSQWASRGRSGENSLPGGIVVDGDVAGLGRIIHKTPSPEAETAFLKQLGMTACNGRSGDSMLEIGNTCLVDLREAELPLPPIEERDMLYDAWIMRVYGMESFRRRLAELGGDFLSQHDFPGGALDYALTPSYRVIGWQERKRYDPRVPTTQMVEDLDARSRWIRRKNDGG